MNRSIVITRYALSLVKYVSETGGGDVVCSEAETLMQALRGVPELACMITASDDVVSPHDKIKLLQGALGSSVSHQMNRFLSLLIRQGRMPLAPDILRNFVVMYRRSQGVVRASLVTAEEPSEHLLGRLRTLVKQKTGFDVIIDVEVDPSLIGGFVFDIDEYLLDASVKRQLDIIREQFIERNRRIV